MNIKLIISVVFAGVLVAVFWLADNDHDQPEKTLHEIAEPAPPEPAFVDSTTPSRVPTEVSDAAKEAENKDVEDHALSIADDTEDSPKWPNSVENLIFDYLSQLEGFKFTAITSVQCDAHTCEIVFSGLDPNPTIVDDYSKIMGGLYLPPINAQQGSIETREIIAGAREFVVSISNMPYIEPTADQ